MALANMLRPDRASITSTKVLRAAIQFARRLKSRLDRRSRARSAKSLEKIQLDELYKTRPYLHAYRAHTDMRVAQDPHGAVGGMWDEIGRLQFDFLIRNGLDPHASLLDIGCGTLRGGRFFVRYLDPGRYTGFDISPAAIAYAHALIRDEGLEGKRPRLLVSKHQDLRFREFAGERFDFILAQSVFTHLQPEHIEQCFEHIGNAMHATSCLFFTYSESDRIEQKSLKDFSQPWSFFADLAAKYGFLLEGCSHDYHHPRSQKMVKMTKKREWRNIRHTVDGVPGSEASGA